MTWSAKSKKQKKKDKNSPQISMQGVKIPGPSERSSDFWLEKISPNASGEDRLHGGSEESTTRKSAYAGRVYGSQLPCISAASGKPNDVRSLLLNHRKYFIFLMEITDELKRNRLKGHFFFCFAVL